MAYSGWSLGRVIIFGERLDDHGSQVSIWHSTEPGRWDAFMQASEPFKIGSGRMGFIGRSLVTRMPIWITDLPAFPALVRAAVIEKAGFRSALAFPVIAVGRIFALLEFFSVTTMPPDEALLDALPEIGSQVAHVAERRASEQALRESVDFARATIDALSDHICVLDEAGRILTVNRAWKQFAADNGLQVDEWIGVNYLQACERAEGQGADDAITARQGIADILQGRSSGFTFEYCCPGSFDERWFAMSATLFTDRTPRRVVVSHRDITRRRLAARRGAMDHAAAKVLAEAATIEAALSQLLQVICEAMEWRYGAYWKSGTDGELRRIAHWGVDLDQFVTQRGPWMHQYRDDADTLLRSALEGGKALGVPDARRLEGFSRAQDCVNIGLACAYALPVYLSDDQPGVMEFYGPHVRQTDEALLDVMGSLGSHVSQFMQRQRAEEALRVSEELFRAAFEQASVGITVADLDLGYQQVNDRYCAMLGYTREELLRMTVADVNLPENIAEAHEFRRQLVSGEVRLTVREKQLIRKDGSRLWVSISTSVVRGDRGEPKRFISVLQDISDVRSATDALRATEQQFTQLASNIPQAFWISDVQLRETIYVSPAAEPILGVPLEVLRENPRALVRAVHPEDRARVRKARRFAAGGGYNETYRIQRPDGSVRWVQDRGFPVHDAAGRVYRIAGIAEDVTERRAGEDRLRQMAHFDLLTKLPNRVLFYDRLGQALAQARRHEWMLAVVFIDLDRFKNVNDTLGHVTGDVLLTQVAHRLMQSVRAEDTVGRLGGDEFAILLNHLGDPADASVVAQKILQSFDQPFDLDGSDIYITASIGLTLFPVDNTDQDGLIRNADAAMYRAKELGRNTFQFYRPEMNERARKMLRMESSLRRALERQEFILYYQPKVSISTGKITGLEALLRWLHPERGLVAPAEFIPVLEETGLIRQAGAWVLEQVCRDVRKWMKAGVPRLPVAVNLSARQFVARDLGPGIQAMLEEQGIDPRWLEVEITETSLMENPDEASRTLEYLGTLGIRLALDDFGTGYSSLAYLKRFPLDSLKIDRSFVQGIGTDVDDATITRAVISIAHSLDLRVVAEGVEDETQLAVLRQYGCDEIQGFLFAQPMPAAECGRWLLEGRCMELPRR